MPDRTRTEPSDGWTAPNAPAAVSGIDTGPINLSVFSILTKSAATTRAPGALYRQLSVLLAQPVELIALALTQRARTDPSTPVQIHPLTQRGLVQAQLSRRSPEVRSHTGADSSEILKIGFRARRKERVGSVSLSLVNRLPEEHHRGRS